MGQKWLKEEKEKQDGNNNDKNKQQNTANCTKGMPSQSKWARPKTKPSPTRINLSAPNNR